MTPKLGLNPTMPQKEAGRITEPPVWVPIASGTMPAATAAAEPEEEPPGVRVGVERVARAAGCIEASSVVTVLPMMTAPAWRRRAHDRSRPCRGRRPASIGVPFSVGMSACR